ncbi:MAG: hypothetical protein ACR2M1_05720, partial [Gemmatimonadaceae bacterium]
LSIIGGWLNLPAITSFLGPVGGLERWLDPVVGHSTLNLTNGVAAEAAHGTEVTLVLVAIAVAVAGIATAVFVLRPASLPTKAEARPEQGVEKVLANHYYVDEAYHAAIVHPTYEISKNVLWRGLDSGIIDSFFVKGSAWVARGLGWIGTRVQTGNVGGYAWLIVIGALAVIGAFSFR